MYCVLLHVLCFHSVPLLCFLVLTDSSHSFILVSVSSLCLPMCASIYFCASISILLCLHLSPLSYNRLISLSVSVASLWLYLSFLSIYFFTWLALMNMPHFSLFCLFVSFSLFLSQTYARTHYYKYTSLSTHCHFSDFHFSEENVCNVTAHVLLIPCIKIYLLPTITV